MDPPSSYSEDLPTTGPSGTDSSQAPYVVPILGGKSSSEPIPLSPRLSPQLIRPSATIFLNKRERSISLVSWSIVRTEHLRIIWQCNSSEEKLEHFLPADVIPHTPHAGLGNEADKLVTFQDHHRVRYTAQRGMVYYNGYSEVEYKFDTVESSMHFQSDLRQKTLVDCFDTDVVWTDKHSRADTFGNTRGVAALQKVKIWEYLGAFSITIWANRTDRLHREYSVDEFESEVRERDDRRRTVRLNVRGRRGISNGSRSGWSFISTRYSARADSDSGYGSTRSTSPSSSTGRRASVSSSSGSLAGVRYLGIQFSRDEDYKRFLDWWSRIDQTNFPTELAPLALDDSDPWTKSAAIRQAPREELATGTEGSKQKLSSKLEDVDEMGAMSHLDHGSLPSPARNEPYPITNTQDAATDFKRALEELNERKTLDLLQNHFGHVAVGEYAWLHELQQLGYSPGEIAEELTEKARHGPWIHVRYRRPIVDPFVAKFHMVRCHHGKDSGGENTGVETRVSQSSCDVVTSSDKWGIEFSIRESIEFLCGIGGARPLFDDILYTNDFSVSFENGNTTAIVYSEIGAMSDLVSCLDDLERAASVLQQVAGCCDSFTFLFILDSGVELGVVDLQVIRELRECIEQDKGHFTFGWSEPLKKLVAQLLQGFGPDVGTWDVDFGAYIAIQFLSLALLSYAQAHTGPIRPFFLDTPLQRVVLRGLSAKQAISLYDGPCIQGSLVELSCFGGMLQQPVFAFEYLDRYSEATQRPGEMRKLDLITTPVDLLDTWGPGEFLAPADDPENIYAISVGGGIITAGGDKDDGRPLLHWSRESRLSKVLTSTFGRREKVTVGGTGVSSNPGCVADPQVQLRKAFSLLEELGTFPSYWEVSERQLGVGIQGGSTAVAVFQFNQSWVKMRGMTKKSKLLAQKSLFVADLDGPFAIQVSVCTGIARRVRLRDMIADVLPVYVAALVTKPPLWRSLHDDFDVIPALREKNLGPWLESLDHDHQSTFESLVFAVLFLLQDTGVDRKGQNFVVGCIQPDLPFQCFKVLCRKENYWARMVADSEEIATFAYMTTGCLETSSVRCRGSGGSWANSTRLFWTMVSCCQDGPQAQTPPINAGPALPVTPPWVLKHSEAYLIGKIDAPLFVQVDRPNNEEEPRLLVSVSTIPASMLLRLHRKRPGKTRRLRERRAADLITESVVVLTGDGGI